MNDVLWEAPFHIHHRAVRDGIDIDVLFVHLRKQPSGAIDVTTDLSNHINHRVVRDGIDIDVLETDRYNAVTQKKNGDRPWKKALFLAPHRQHVLLKASTIWIIKKWLVWVNS